MTSKLVGVLFIALLIFSFFLAVFNGYNKYRPTVNPEVNKPTIITTIKLEKLCVEEAVGVTSCVELNKGTYTLEVQNEGLDRKILMVR